ncbi:MAG TPA: YceI family protein [Acidimicrobiales bacterium]|jgi:polyisoprenoid-binding protein YceI|nr:YceI family protein [Acidimicrobiales bacterium]
MTIAKGTHNIGPQDGKVLVNVYKDGVAAKMGHDLTLGASSWSGKADINPDDPSACSVQITIPIDSLEVLEGKGGAKALSQSDRADIKKNISKTLGRGDIAFESTGVSGSAPNISLQGNLSVGGKSGPVTMNLTVNDNGSVTGTTSFNQSHLGIKPFSAMLGALKVKDGVDVSVDLQLPTA